MNLEALNVKVEESGLKNSFIAKKLKISPQAWNKKLRGEAPVTVENAKHLCEILPFADNDEKVQIFLA